MVESRSTSWERAVSRYVVLLAELVEGRLTADQVEADFEPLYVNDPWPPELFEVLDRFFGDLEAYRASAPGMGADELGASARRTLELLEAVLQEESS